jgi:hypothetical protein
VESEVAAIAVTGYTNTPKSKRRNMASIFFKAALPKPVKSRKV